MIEVLAGLVGVFIAIFIPVSIKTEHRLTRVETKLDVLLEKNGIDPRECKKKGGKK